MRLGGARPVLGHSLARGGAHQRLRDTGTTAAGVRGEANTRRDSSGRVGAGPVGLGGRRGLGRRRRYLGLEPSAHVSILLSTTFARTRVVRLKRSRSLPRLRGKHPRGRVRGDEVRRGPRLLPEGANDETMGRTDKAMGRTEPDGNNNSPSVKNNYTNTSDSPLRKCVAI